MNNRLVLTNPDGTETVLYEAHPKQLEYHSRTEPNVLFWGGRGSGKSTCGRWDAHMRALAHPNFNYCILRRTYPELQRSHLIHVPKEMKQLGGTFNYTNHVATYANGSKGFFSHCANEEDVLNLLSAEFALMVFDELSTFEWEMFTKLAASVRVGVNSGLTAMVRGLTNPLGTSAQKLLEYFVDKTVDREEDPDYNPSDWYSIHANLEDNPSVDQDQYRKRFSGLPSHVYKAWVDGEFVLENALFDFHPRRNGMPYHVVNDIDIKQMVKSATIYRAIDSGWYPDPTVVLWIAHLGNRHVVFHERVLYKHTAAETSQIIKEDDEYLGIKRVATTYCDPTMDINTTADVKTVREMYETNGITLDKSINDREMFASVLHNALAEQAGEATPRIQFFVNGQQGCPYLVKTIPQMRYNPKKPRAMDDHRNDHAVVACCYYLMSHASDLSLDPVSKGPIRPWMREKAPNRFILGSDQVRDRR